MKRIVSLLFIALLSFPVMSQNAYETDVQSIDSIIESLYASISGEKGEERDWDRFRNLFILEAKLMPTGVNSKGVAGYSAWGVEDYIPRVEKSFLENGFIETEISKEVERFRNVAHVFSTYESRRTKEGAIIARGINSIQLFYDNNRWWVVSVFWASENPDHPIPEKYDIKN
ncbi:MAG TPA: hypothetical protein DCL80_12145 [Balneola sp.]|jgi:hypothetical protein|nr:hypothetical protein [Bacteroidota bacterium]MAO77224.1 hypothetical protein [Balneola sp.]MBF65962.1 hypothetical protein [Balneola sp.]MBF66059.1 hypothetical protein [Balneola sp.]HAH51955.1 hypothetical protein [Balneola sp.]